MLRSLVGSEMCIRDSACAARCQHEPERARSQTQYADRVEHEDGEDQVLERVEGGALTGERAQAGVAEDSPQTLGDLLSPGLAICPWLRHGLASLDAPQTAGGEQVGESVEQQRHWGAKDLDQHTREPRTGHPCQRLTGLELAVAVSELPPGHESWKVGEVGQVEQHGETSDQESDPAEQGNREPPGDCRQWNQADERGSRQVRACLLY